MPEMPELEVLQEVLGPQLKRQEIVKVTVSPKFGFLLRTPPADLALALEGAVIKGLWRRGKFLVVDVDHRRLVLNPMLGGRLHWAPAAAKPPPSVIFALELKGGNVLRLTDFA